MTLRAFRIESAGGKVAFVGALPGKAVAMTVRVRTKCRCGLEVEIGRTTDGEDACLAHPEPLCMSFSERTISEIERSAEPASKPRLADFQKPLLEALAAHEAFRKLGFSSEQLFMHENPEPHGDIGVLLKHSEKTFRFTVGRPAPGWEEQWVRLVKLYNDGEFASEELNHWYDTSFVRMHYPELLLALHAKGIAPPYEAN